MRLVDARTGIEVLDRATCVRLLADDMVGRLGMVAGGTPVIFPVNYRMDGEVVVFRTAAGTKLEWGGRGPACFEIDRFNRAQRTGWSVLATGRLEEVTHHTARILERVSALPVDPWAEGDKPHWMRLVPTRITGRRIA